MMTSDREKRPLPNAQGRPFPVMVGVRYRQSRGWSAFADHDEGGGGAHPDTAAVRDAASADHNGACAGQGGVT